jgi:bifunctional DNA-binding transcriptional regulator/antitoxin component of YhaV-PrlF toxin-antitoxin module
MPVADKPKAAPADIEVEVEKRRKLGLPETVLELSGLKPGDRVQVQVRRDGRIVIVRLVDLLDKYAGAIPGISAATNLDATNPEGQRRE